MTKTIYVFVWDKGEPEIYTDIFSANQAVLELVNDIKERWGYDNEDVKECLDEFNACTGDYRGSYLGDNQFGYYIREIEL